jgi:hypothetical protein
LQVGDTGPVESARRSNSRVLGSPFSGLSGQKLSTLKMINWEKVILKVYVNRYLFKTKVQFLHLKAKASSGTVFRKRFRLREPIGTCS